MIIVNKAQLLVDILGNTDTIKAIDKIDGSKNIKFLCKPESRYPQTIIFGAHVFSQTGTTSTRCTFNEHT